MRAWEREGLALGTLAAMPFLDRLELAAVMGTYEEAAHVALRSLRQAGLVHCLRHASPLTATTRRWYVTADGLRSLALESGTGIDRLLRTHPVSAHWRRLLLARLDTVAVIYRLTSAVAVAVGPPRFRWYRAAPLDAAMTLPDGRTVGVFRQGPTADRTSISDRVRRLIETEQSRPRALLALMPDEARLRHARRLMDRYPGPVYLTMESHAAGLLPDDRVWHTASAPALLSLSEVVSHLRPGGAPPWEPPPSRLSLPEDIGPPQSEGDVADHLLPVVLKPAEKRMLDCLSDWPLTTVEDLSGILGLSDSRIWRLSARLRKLGLLSHALLDGRRRLALSKRALALLARTDRTSVAAAFRRWSVEPIHGETPSSWRGLPGVRCRPLARAIDHTQAVHRFLAALVWQTKGIPGYSVSRLSPPHHGARYFRYAGTLRSIHPDAFGIVRVNGRDRPFFLEWERRALNPSTMIARIAPYLRYYSSNRPLDDHGERPMVLIVFEDTLVEANFLGLARREMERAKVRLPLWASSQQAIERAGPLGKVWRSPDVLEPVSIFG